MKRNYSDPVYKQVRSNVLKRDKKVCQMPGCTCKRKLEVHHISKWSSSPSLRYEESNMITLCSICHKSIKNKEDFYVSLFIQIVKQNTDEYNKRHKRKKRI
jgi:5-methylcytosine-specific restriction endonuclease McrA